MKRLASLGFLLVTACTSAFTQLPEHEQDRWQRCYGLVRAAQCYGEREMVGESICMRTIVDRYADRPTERERQDYLLYQGCTPMLVGTLAASGNERRVPQAVGTVERSNDPTTGELRLTGHMHATGSLDVLLRGAPETNADTVRLAVVSRGAPRFEGCTRVDLVADGQPVPSDAGTYDTGRGMQAVQVVLPLARLADLAAANGIQARVCTLTVALGPAHLPIVRAFLSQFRRAAQLAAAALDRSRPILDASVADASVEPSPTLDASEAPDVPAVPEASAETGRLRRR